MLLIGSLIVAGVYVFSCHSLCLCVCACDCVCDYFGMKGVVGGIGCMLPTSLLEAHRVESAFSSYLHKVTHTRAFASFTSLQYDG